MRAGKSFAMATLVARALKEGQRVVTISAGEAVEIVGVPGFDDGRQLSPPNVFVARATKLLSHGDPNQPLDPQKSAT